MTIKAQIDRTPDGGGMTVEQLEQRASREARGEVARGREREGQGAPRPGRAHGEMTVEQIDGLHCVYCAQAGGRMVPAWGGPRGLMFQHVDCGRSDSLPTGPGQSIGGQRAPSRRESLGVGRRPGDGPRARIGAPPTSEVPPGAPAARPGSTCCEACGRQLRAALKEEENCDVPQQPLTRPGGPR